MAAKDPSREQLESLTKHAAASLGPIAVLIVEQAAATGGSLDAVRRKIAGQMDAAAGKAFLAATERLAAESSAPAHGAATPSVPPGALVQPGSATLDRSDPALVRALGAELAARIGPSGQSIVQEAARKCRTTVQLYLRLAAAVDDPDLKATLSQRAAGEAAARSARRS
jgi:hypothetical protein